MDDCVSLYVVMAVPDVVAMVVIMVVVIDVAIDVVMFVNWVRVNVSKYYVRCWVHYSHIRSG